MKISSIISIIGLFLITGITIGIPTFYSCKGFAGRLLIPNDFMSNLKANWNPASCDPHDSISIIANNGFTALNGVRGGSGTIDSPWILENWSINGDIFVQNTSDYFIIRHCLLTGKWTRGKIELDNVTHGVLENNIFEINGTYYGISLFQSPGNLVQNNWCWNISNLAIDNKGIFLRGSDNNSLVGNFCANLGYCGILIQSSDNTSIINNTLQGMLKGIEIWNSSLTVIHPIRSNIARTG